MSASAMQGGHNYVIHSDSQVLSHRHKTLQTMLD